MPALFTTKFYDEIPGQIVLADLPGNEFTLALVKDDRKLFVAGWKNIGAFYGLHLGGFFRMVYLGQGGFFIQVFNNYGDEVVYPPLPITQPSPATPTNVEGVGETVLPLPENSAAGAPPDFFLAYSKDLTFGDITKNFLICLLLFALSNTFFVFFHFYCNHTERNEKTKPLPLCNTGATS